MDINSLLSPSETPRTSSQTPGSGTPAHSPFKNVQRTHSAQSAQPIVNSPLARAIQPPSSIPAHVRSPSQQPPHSSPLISPVPTDTISTHFAPSSSTLSMDTLADLASMQNHQPSKQTPPNMTSRDSSDSQKLSSSLFPHLTAATATSNSRASFDIAMVETPKQTLRADYTDSSLSPEAQQRLSVLVAYVHETPSSYDAHKEIIKILHQGLVDHIYPSSSPNARRDPRTYDLLPELRQARENLDKLFAVGEEQWLDWLQDESLLAQTAEERVAVVDKCRLAVTEEYGSTKLWVTYGEWVLHCYKWALDTSGDRQGEADAERMVGREVFDWPLVLDTWTEAIQLTKHDLSYSHEVWDKYMTVRFGDTGQNLSASEATAALELFLARLRVPHAEWQQTFATFSTFVSTNIPAEQYEGIMASTLRDSAAAKKVWADRDMFETALQEARRTVDQSAEYQAFSKYIEWEHAEEENYQNQRKGKSRRDARSVQNTEFDMVASLYQRAELRFPSVLAIWEEHIDYMVEKSKTELLEILARATKHCPWSGSLWKQYLLTSELAEEPFDETEKIKHRATSTGLLDAAGIEEATLVYDAWCGYLLRRTRRPDAVEEDSDVAEMGIRSSIEAVHSLASKLGADADFDPAFRLQRKYVEYLKSQRRFDNARSQFDDAIADYGKSYKFWLRFYEFEIQKHVHMAFVQRSGPERLASLSSAPFAAGILKRGLQHPNLDYPESLIEALLNHCEDYEDAEELQSAMSLVRKVQKTLTAKRHRDALQAKEMAVQLQQAEAELANRTHEVANGLHIGKRKREEESEEHGEVNKRSRSDDVAEQSVESPPAPEEQLKRDREHASILVQNLPAHMSETKIRQYFSSCGMVKNLKQVQDEEHSVIVEFEDADAASFALSRDGREFENSIISVVLNTGSTLYVTNYPAAADEAYIRDLLKPYGEIINVRFPSLQRNKRRRFCYVEFKLPRQAQAATELDNKEIDGLQIVVKISNPAVRQTRTNKKADNKTLFVGQLSFKATEDDIEKLFSKYGQVDHVRLPQDAKVKYKNKGIAFVTFANEHQAQEALAMDGQEFMGRKLSVKNANSGGSRGNKSISGRSKSPSMQPDGEDDSASARRQSETDVAFVEDRRQRTVAIADVPDTVNESRVKAIAEKIGWVRKVMLKTNHQGALIEFETIADAGRAMIELDGHEIDPGRHIRVTTEKDMMQQKPELKQDQFVKRPAQNRPPPATANAPLRRPVQPGVRKGGNLGQRSRALFHADGKNSTMTDGPEDDVVKKTNDDFRSLINKG